MLNGIPYCNHSSWYYAFQLVNMKTCDSTPHPSLVYKECSFFRQKDKIGFLSGFSLSRSGHNKWMVKTNLFHKTTRTKIVFWNKRTLIVRKKNAYQLQKFLFVLEIMLVCFSCFYKTIGRSSCFNEPSKVKGDWLDGPVGRVKQWKGMGIFTPLGRSILSLPAVAWL